MQSAFVLKQLANKVLRFCPIGVCSQKPLLMEKNKKKEGFIMNLQEAIYIELEKERVPVTLYLMNGFQQRGVIVAHDESMIAMVADGKQHVFYKHAISTIAPMRPLKCLENR